MDDKPSAISMERMNEYNALSVMVFRARDEAAVALAKFNTVHAKLLADYEVSGADSFDLVTGAITRAGR